MARQISMGCALRCGETEEHELVFFAFDLLYRDGKDLRALPLIERKRRLMRLVGQGGDTVLAPGRDLR